MNKAKIALVLGVIVIFTVPILAGLALTMWNKNFDWGFPTESFQVYTDSAHQNIWNQNNETLTAEVEAAYHSGLSVLVKTFYIVNDGTLPVTVGVVEGNISGATASWNASLPLAKGESGVLQLTLTITAVGNYSFQFVLA